MANKLMSRQQAERLRSRVLREAMVEIRNTHARGVCRYGVFDHPNGSGDKVVVQAKRGHDLCEGAILDVVGVVEIGPGEFAVSHEEYAGPKWVWANAKGRVSLESLGEWGLLALLD